MHSMLNFVLFTGGLWLMVLTNSEAEKWSWPVSGKDRDKEASNRKDVYYESISGSGEGNGRIRVPSSYQDYNDRRPYAQQYQVRESTTNKPKPLSDEFSNEFTASGESYNGNNRYQPNRFGTPQSQANDYPGFGYPQQGSFGVGPYSQFGPGGFPGAQHYPVGGASGYPGQFPIHGGNPLGYPQQNNLANGLLVGPGGPTGIIGRPGFSPYQGGGYPGVGGGYPQQGGYSGHPGYPPRQPFGFEGQHNSLGAQHNGFGGGQFNPAFAGSGGFGGGNPYGGGINPYNQQFGSSPYGPYYDSQGKNSAVKKVEKSAKSN
ncbi:unnamed protein product [Chironomus riparius]|uniref:Uncharacterized protein n=1 Tax=Chironomus riparius TaxID=315576 RepID=A0A9P0J6V5_9DIPT|nr:unnamed protein product [Chironomus riparius]